MIAMETANIPIEEKIDIITFTHSLTDFSENTGFNRKRPRTYTTFPPMYKIINPRFNIEKRDISEFSKVIIENLIRGPKKELVRTIPEGTTLNALYVTHDGTAYVDMSEAIKENHPGGSESELITIYSIVNSLILNIPEIDAVKILIEGNESMTLAGHVDLRFPFEANMLLIR